LSASLRSVSAISEYFMLIQCLENIGEGLLHACISSLYILPLWLDIVINISMREQNEPRNCVEYTQRVFIKRRNCVNIAKCLVQNKWLFYDENGHDLN
jgi:hypothetical protein